MPNEASISSQAGKRLFTGDFILGFFSYFFFLAAVNSLTPTLPLYLVRLSSNEREIGVLIGVLAVASLASRLFVGGALLKYRAKSVMMVGAFASSLTFLAYIVFHPFWPLFAVRLLQGAAWACIDTAAITSIVGIIPLAYRARALGYFMLAPSLAMAVAALWHVSHLSVKFHDSFPFLRRSLFLHPLFVLENEGTEYRSGP
jgi:MFS family permease